MFMLFWGCGGTTWNPHFSPSQMCFFCIMCAPKRLFRFIFVSFLLPWVTAGCPLQAEREALLLLEALRELMTQVSLPPWASRK